MENATLAVTGALLFLLLAGAGVIMLQIFLSKKESRWPGLVMPCISFAVALLAVLSVLLFTAVTSTTGYYDENGVFIEQAVTQITETSTVVISVVYVFMLYNIPTGILIAIYAACRGKRKKQRELEKMSVQDL